MKALIKLFILLLVFPVVSMGETVTLPYDIGLELKAELELLHSDENISDRMRAVIAGKKIKRVVNKHIKRSGSSLTEKVREIIQTRGPMPSDVLADILLKVFGEKMSDLIMRISAIPAVEAHLTGLVLDWQLLLKAETCPDGLKKVVGHLAFVAGVAAVIIFAPPPFTVLAVQAGVIAGAASDLLIDVTKLNYRACSIIYE